MIEALNMQLEIIRTVLSNEVNEISVCEDLKRKTGVYYTMISIRSASVRRQVAQLLGAGGMLSTNRDYIGSFSHGDSLSLLFLYRQENLLLRREAIYATDFAKRKRMVESMLVALAETQMDNSVGMLLLADRNINVANDGVIYFNYFLDFAKWKPEETDSDFYLATAKRCFDILAREYEAKYDGRLQSYPSELQVFYKKAQLRSFTSFSTIMTFVKIIPDIPSEPSVGFKKLFNGIKGIIREVRANASSFFILLLVTITVVFTGYQITMRLTYRNQTKHNTVYNGMETIGEVFLGDENV